MMTEKTEKNPIPNPGSDAAIAAGCECPVMDNNHGKGYYGQAGVFIYSSDCKLHAKVYSAATESE